MPIELHSGASPRRRALNWAVALGYVAFIYATLGAVPAPLAYLRSQGVLRLTFGTLFLLCWCGLLVLLASRSRRWWRFAAMFLLAGVYALTAQKLIRTPEEQIHFIQYGLVGVLFMRAVRPWLNREGASYVVAFLLAFGAGWLDEILQGRLPNRHYDLRDIYLNAASALLGLVVYRIIPRRR
jgi:VanZ family protein